MRNSEWHLKALDIADAHKITKGSGITVGLVDTGVATHPDLSRNVLKGTDVLEPGSGDGRTDDDGHGTEMAGLIAAHGSREDGGVLGIAPEAKILPIRDSHPGRVGSSSVVASGIVWAADNGAKVINVSSANGPSVALAEAAKSASAKDIVVVAAAGNRPEYLQFGYPAAIPGVLAVGSSDRDDKHAAFSFSGEAVQLCAPGVDIVSTRNRGKYSISDGTSSSTAIVSGAAALVRAKFPDLSAQQVIERLTSTATDVGPPGRDKECGFGVLNIVKALTSGSPSASSRSEPASPAPTTTTTTHTAPDADEGTPVALVASVVGGLVVILGGLVGLLVARRRRGAG